ncbi:MAG: hypothetical protein NZ529_06940, partial [Cytophagaceae bacterium]|nr:hypothetical protein [Cytophagaceae bacterium]MDW8456517.1 hypothetical protein [Cytophagaceae bacterium]
MKIILFMEKLKGLLKKVVCFSVVMTFLLRLGYSEGTRELLVRPTPLGFFDSTKIGPGVQIWDTPWQSNRRTGTYASIASGGMGVASDAIYRIKIRICNVGEVINMGFDQPDNDVFFRLYKPDGTTVQFDDAMVINPGDATTATLFGGEQGALGHPYTYRVPRSTDNAGYIRFFRQAYVGPQPATGQVNGVGPVSNGYIPIQHIADQVGEYYIVFNPTHPDNLTMAKRVFRKFDITVWNNMASKTVRRGRLYSAAWDFNCNSDIETFNSELFFYSKDSVVTAVRFNQMQPFGFIITANSTGCT